MANENENEDIEQQQNDTQQQQQDTGNENPVASTGSKQWDDIIDQHADTGQKQDKQNGDARGKTAENTQQRTQQSNTQQQRGQETQQGEVSNQRRQGNVEGEGNYPARTTARKFGDVFFAGQDGNIYDSQGAKIASQGGARATFHRIWNVVEPHLRELDSLRQRVTNYENANAVAKQQKLSLDDQGAALQMYAHYKKDPVKTISTLLTLAEQGGMDVSSIRQGGGGLSLADMRAVMEEIVDSRMKPFSFITEDRQAQLAQREAQEAAQTEYTAFIEEFPDAERHVDAIATVMRKRDVNVREAYFITRTLAAERGLDWNKPLAEQLAAQQQEQNRNPSGGAGNRSRQVPRMGGRTQSDTTHVANGSRDQSGAEESWDAIGRRAMAKFNIPV